MHSLIGLWSLFSVVLLFRVVPLHWGLTPKAFGITFLLEFREALLPINFGDRNGGAVNQAVAARRLEDLGLGAPFAIFCQLFHEGFILKFLLEFFKFFHFFSEVVYAFLQEGRDVLDFFDEPNEHCTCSKFLDITQRVNVCLSIFLDPGELF